MKPEEYLITFFDNGYGVRTQYNMSMRDYSLDILTGTEDNYEIIDSRYHLSEKDLTKIVIGLSKQK